MTKYEIKKNYVEIKYADRMDIEPGCSAGSESDEVLESFDSKEKAIHALKKYESSIDLLSSNAGSYFAIEEFVIEENKYDEDGDFVDGGDILEFSKMEIKLIDEDSGKVIACFDNMSEAEDAYNNYDGENEVHLSY